MVVVNFFLLISRFFLLLLFFEIRVELIDKKLKKGRIKSKNICTSFKFFFLNACKCKR